MNKYCDIDVNFPKIAWIGVLFVSSKEEDDGKRLILLKRLARSKKEEIEYLKIKNKEFGKILKDEYIYGATIVKIKLNRLLENKKDCWTKVNKNEMIVPSFRDELYNAINMLSIPKLYEILVVASSYDKKKNWDVGVASVLTKGKGKKELDDYMAKLSVYVNRRAKQSALYEVTGRIGLSFETGKERIVKGEIIPIGSSLA